ncbi:unnamed protein product [Symbiodinium sp. CCMP2592]|nr:unnamed protein product [Symbiodinium sp. CCMP2592]
MLPIILLPGEAVTLIEASVSHESGYLAARQDEKVEVLYVGRHDDEDEAGWIYVQRLGEDDRDKSDEKQGWIDTKLVKLDRRVGDKVIVGPNLQPAVYDVVQLICRSGDAVEVKHWGREDNEDERNWIYAEGPDQKRGWLHLESVEKLQTRSSDHNAPRPWHALLQDTDLLPFPNIAPERQSQYASYETRKVSITKGMVVQVEQYEDKWVKVKVSKGVCGWMLTSNLKADASQEPPPPSPSPPPAAAVKMTSLDASKGLPPKPSRPPPRASHVEPAPAPAVATGAECRDGRDGPALEPKAATKLPPPPPPSEPCPSKVSGQRPGRQPGAAQTGGALPQQAVAQISDADAAGGGSLGRIGLATFGLETLDGDLCSKCYEHPGGGAAYRASDEELNEALTRRKFPSEVILDARMFPDPDAGNVTRHSGRHHLIITRLFNHRNFKMWLERAKRKIEKAARDAAPSGGGSGSFNVAVYCRAGKHRSVAASVILHYILKAEGWTCPDVQHLSYERWGRNCCKGQCQECLDPPEQLQDILRSALRLWRDLR